jgi:hypothetical protein
MSSRNSAGLLRLVSACGAAFALTGGTTLGQTVQDANASPESVGQVDPPAEQPVEEMPFDLKSPEETPPPANLTGPKYSNLRYDDDFSYLDGEPGTYIEDDFDPIKNVHLDDNWRLSLGGEVRIRMESSTNVGFGASTLTQDNYQLYRSFVHFNLNCHE